MGLQDKKEYDYPSYVIHAIRKWAKWNQNEYLTTYEIRSIEPERALELYLEWEGIYGYTSSILAILNAKEVIE